MHLAMERFKIRFHYLNCEFFRLQIQIRKWVSPWSEVIEHNWGHCNDRFVENTEYLNRTDLYYNTERAVYI